MKQARKDEPEDDSSATQGTSSGTTNSSNSEATPPEQRTWTGASGRVYHAPPGRRTPPFLGMNLCAPMFPSSMYPPPRRMRVPHPCLIDQPITLLDNLPLPQSAPGDENTQRGPQPKTMDVHILTGSINQIVEWTENAQAVPLYEVTGFLFGLGMVNSKYPPAPGNELNLLLRDRRDSGPILQVIRPCLLFPEMPSEIETGQLLRCVGKILDARRMLAIKITIVPPNELADYNRFEHVSQKSSKS